MGFDDGQIILNSDNGTYFPGQTIQARLVFNQDKIKKFRGIYAKIKGYCDVHWTSTHRRTNAQGKQETYHKVHESHEEYINRKLYIVGGESGEHELAPGNHDFPFEFALPPNCPSSFEGSVGHIRYEIKVVVDRAFKLDQEKKVAIRVISLVDLNADPYCQEPMQMEFEESYCCCCMSSGSTETLVKLPKSGYCPGQVIPAEVSCSNKGGVEIDSIQLIIKKEITYTATTNPDTKTEKSVLAEVRTGPVAADTARDWRLDVAVPDHGVCGLQACRFIRLDYWFKVVVSPGGCHSDTSGSKRLVLGNIPLTGYQDSAPNPCADRMPQLNVPLDQAAPHAYPQNTPYPGGPHPAPYPSNPAPYPSNPAPYPSNPVPAMPPYPTVTPYPSNAPYPPAPTPYPPQNNPPYPTNAPYPQTSPYPPAPYPPTNTPYPAAASPLASALKTGNMGFVAPPGLSPGNAPSPASSMTNLNPYASASAPLETADKQ